MVKEKKTKKSLDKAPKKGSYLMSRRYLEAQSEEGQEAAKAYWR
jgi:hypothetical protein